MAFNWSASDRQSSSCISWEVVEATCACLLAQGEEAEKEHCSESLAEQMIDPLRINQINHCDLP